jgi:hypothetical protein
MSLDAQPVAPVEGLMALVVKLADEAHANGCEQGSTRGYTMDRSSESAIESAILQYAERLASRTTIQTWQPIETAPKDGTSILGYWATGGKHDCSMYACKYVSGHPSLRQGWWQTNEDYPTSPPTHWMPLPPPPLSQVQGGLSTNNEEMK